MPQAYPVPLADMAIRVPPAMTVVSTQVASFVAESLRERARQRGVSLADLLRDAILLAYYSEGQAHTDQ